MNFAYIWRCTLKSLLRSKTWEELGFRQQANSAGKFQYTLRLMLQTLSFGFCAGVPIARSAWEVRIPSLATLDTTSLAFTTSTASNFLHIPIKMQTHPVWTRWTKSLDLMTSLFDFFGNSERVPYYITALPTSVFRIFHFSYQSNLSNCAQLTTSGCSLEDWWKNVRWCSGYVIGLYQTLLPSSHHWRHFGFCVFSFGFCTSAKACANAPRLLNSNQIT